MHVQYMCMCVRVGWEGTLREWGYILGHWGFGALLERGRGKLLLEGGGEQGRRWGVVLC